MSTPILQDIPAKDRRDKLKELAKKVEFNTTYQMPLTQAELDYENRIHSKEAIEKQRLEAELKDITDQYKAKIKGQEAKMNAALERIKSEKQDMQGDLYGIANFDTNRIEYYTHYGIWIYGRELMPTELQASLFNPAQAEGEELTPLDVANQIMDEAAGKANVLNMMHQVVTDTYDTPARFEARVKLLEAEGFKADDDFTCYAYMNHEGNPVTAPERGLVVSDDYIHNLTDAQFEAALIEIRKSIHQYRIDMAQTPSDVMADNAKKNRSKKK